MRKSKRVEAEAPAAPVAAPEPQEPPVLQMTRVEMMELRAHTAEARFHTTNMALQALQRDQYLEKIDPEGKLAAMNKAIRAAADSSAAATAEQKRVKEEIEKRLGIDDLKKYTYDDLSGILQLADQ